MVYEYKDVVIGSCLDAVLYAFNNSYPIFFTEPSRPFRFKFLPNGVSLESLKIASFTRSLNTNANKIEVGISEELLWERMLFLLSLRGLVPLSDLCHNIRYDGDRVVCSNEYSKIFEFKFENCHYFGDHASNGFVVEKSFDDSTYLCYDYIAFNKGGKHDIDYIHTGDDFVSEIWFYGSDRIDGNTPVRDACAVSRLTGKQLTDFDYSETMARFKVINEMESIGMKGVFAHAYTKTGKPKHYNFRATSIRRETDRQGNSYESQSENVKIAEVDSKSLIRNLPKACLAYDRFLRHL